MSINRRSRFRVIHSKETEASPPKGRITHDARGNAVWDWGIGHSELEATSTTGLLKKLSGADALALESDPNPPLAGSGDPYNRKCG
jgi:hypothetical protein